MCLDGVTWQKGGESLGRRAQKGGSSLGSWLQGVSDPWLAGGGCDFVGCAKQGGLFLAEYMPICATFGATGCGRI